MNPKKLVQAIKLIEIMKVQFLVASKFKGRRN